MRGGGVVRHFDTSSFLCFDLSTLFRYVGVHFWPSAPLLRRGGRMLTNTPRSLEINSTRDVLLINVAGRDVET